MCQTHRFSAAFVKVPQLKGSVVIFDRYLLWLNNKPVYASDLKRQVYFKVLSLVFRIAVGHKVLNNCCKGGEIGIVTWVPVLVSISCP